MNNEVVVYLTRLGEPETGLWCRHCLLPSAIRIHFALSSKTAPISLGTIERCLEWYWALASNVHSTGERA